MCAQQINLSDTLFEDEFAQLEMPYEGDTVSSPIALDAVFDCYSSDLRNEALRRLSYIEWFDRNLSAGWTKNNINALMDDASKYLEEPLPNWRTIVHWRQRYYQQGKKLVALIPRTNGKGNRQSALIVEMRFSLKKPSQVSLTRKNRPLRKHIKTTKTKFAY